MLVSTLAHALACAGSSVVDLLCLVGTSLFPWAASTSLLRFTVLLQSCRPKVVVNGEVAKYFIREGAGGDAFNRLWAGDQGGLG